MKKLLIIKCHKCGQNHPYNFINSSNKDVGDICYTNIGANNMPKGWRYCQAKLKKNMIQTLTNS